MLTIRRNLEGLLAQSDLGVKSPPDAVIDGAGWEWGCLGWFPAPASPADGLSEARRLGGVDPNVDPRRDDGPNP